MYETFFGLNEKPFTLTPNPRFLFLSKTHNEVYAHLLYGIESRAGFVEVTGEVGTGKTTLLRTQLSHLDENKYRIAFIFNPKLTAFELLRNINREFGVNDAGLSNPDLIHALNEFLLVENQVGRTPILVIDEAQNLSGEVLEQIRLLSNLETEEDKLIQIVLVGQPELRRHLGDYSLRQLNQRIAVRYQLQPLNRDETISYILHRLKIAGRPDGNIFSAAALKQIFHCSAGVPRRINLICDRALLTAFSEGRGVVSRRDVGQAVAELDGMGERGQSTHHLTWKPVAMAVVLLLVILAVFFRLDPFGQRSADENVAQITGSQTNEVHRSMVSFALPAAPPRPNSLIESCNAVFSLWNASLLNEEDVYENFDFDHEFNQRGFNLIHLAGRFDELSKFNLPVVVQLPDQKGEDYLAVLGPAASDSWSVAPAYHGRTTLSSAELNAFGDLMGFVPWVDFSSIGDVAVPGMQGDNVSRLQSLLGITGCTNIAKNGRFGSASIECVKTFQREHGLIVDGIVGPRTLLLLYQVAGGYKMPQLF